MHGGRGEEAVKRRWHMRPVPGNGRATPETSAAASPNRSKPLIHHLPDAATDSPRSASDSFFKEGRRIQVGDCALFQAGNAPPLIGIIRWLITGKGDHLKLGVNWLYRPADLKLAKGICLEAAPNEVFYSFHKGVIAASALLHPCKVAFLPKGVELPAWISSFVCRRVYDIAEKCLCWLTDQDYPNERQGEVDRLLDKTKQEMHAAVQPEGSSPKPSNGTSQASHLKSGSEILSSNGASPSLGPGRKRGRSDQVIDKVKRERNLEVEDVNVFSFQVGNSIKAKIAKITEKGKLANPEAVDKLLHLMLLDKAERNMDLSTRLLLAEVIASTDKIECLFRFVQLRGVPVLDDWLQEAHRGKASDGSSLKETDKGVEELVLTLLRALDKLPVNLDALRMCNIGKSVNHLRSHKNVEIQKKSRSLVDTWKKRVDAEMTKINDAKAAVESNQAIPWSAKPGFPDVSHSGSLQAASNDVITKMTVAHPSSDKSLVIKLNSMDVTMKQNTLIPGASKIPTLHSKPVLGVPEDSHGKAAPGSGNSDVPQVMIKEEKSSSSSHSQNNSLTYSSDHAKSIGSSWKEDARSTGNGRASGVTMGHPRSNNGLSRTATCGVQKDANTVKSGHLKRAKTVEKSSQFGFPSGGHLYIPSGEQENNQKLIVRISNRSHSPAQASSGGSLEDPSNVGSRASSPKLKDREGFFDEMMKQKSNSFQALLPADANTKSWQSNGVREGLVGGDEGDGSSTVIPYEECVRTVDELGKGVDVKVASCSSSGNEKGLLSANLNTISCFTSINALIESCVIDCEPSSPLVVGDITGMNLLASVAAGEITRSDLISPTGSPERSVFVEMKGLSSDNVSDIASLKHGIHVDSQLCDKELQPKSAKPPDDKDVGAPPSSDKLSDENIVSLSKPGQCTEQVKDSSVKSDEEHEEIRATTSPAVCSEVKFKDDESPPHNTDQKTCGMAADDGSVNNGVEVRSLSVDGVESGRCTTEKNTEGVCMAFTADAQVGSNLIRGDGSDSKPGSNQEAVHLLSIEQKDSQDISHVSFAIGDCHENTSPLKSGRSESLDAKASLAFVGMEGGEESKVDGADVSATVNDDDMLHCNETPDKKFEDFGAKQDVEKSPALVDLETRGETRSSNSREVASEGHGKQEIASSAEPPSSLSSEASDIRYKLAFDLNEDIIGDEETIEPVTIAPSALISAVCLPASSPFTGISILNPLHCPIAVAAPAKGPFVPPETLLKNKGEYRWKGSAATSAFRPAEPRRHLEMQLNNADAVSCDSTNAKSGSLLCIDLNVADERVPEEFPAHVPGHMLLSNMASVNGRGSPFQASGGIDLDLNKVEEAMDNREPENSSMRIEAPLLPAKPSSLGNGNSNGAGRRVYDLNCGPGLEEAIGEPIQVQYSKIGGGLSYLPAHASLRANHTELGNIPAWFPPVNSYPTVTFTPFLPDKEQTFPILAPSGVQTILGSVTDGTNTSTYGNDIYRSSVLSTPAMAYSPAPAYPYAAIPFNSNFPLSASFPVGPASSVDPSLGASCFASVPSIVGTTIPSHYPRSYPLSLPEGGLSDSKRRWGKQGLDLNTGPGTLDAELKDDRFSLSSRQISVSSTHSISEQARMFQIGGGVLKRKEPEGGWEQEKFIYKPPPHMSK